MRVDGQTHKQTYSLQCFAPLPGAKYSNDNAIRCLCLCCEQVRHNSDWIEQLRQKKRAFVGIYVRPAFYAAEAMAELSQQAQPHQPDMARIRGQLDHYAISSKCICFADVRKTVLFLAVSRTQGGSRGFLYKFSGIMVLLNLQEVIGGSIENYKLYKVCQ